MKKGKKVMEPAEVKMDENGNVIPTEEKKIDLKGIGKKVLAGIGLACGCVVAFIAVGMAMDSNSDHSEDTDIFGTDSEDPVDEGSTDAESGETSEN